MKPYWSDGTVTLHLGDCLDVLAAMEPASVDAVVTDPPYGLEFMGREWDSFQQAPRRVKGTGGSEAPFAHHAVELSPARNRAYQPWCEQWAAECLRVLKPGGHLLAFGGTRTWHRLACGIEDAGFEIRDSVADLTGRDGPGLLWLYGSGFPKSLDVSKAIDKAAGAEREVVGTKLGRPGMSKDGGNQRSQFDAAFDGGVGTPMSSDITAPATEDAARWQGWGTALKPAWEPIVVARKPLAGTVAGNVTEHGTGALNVDGCRVDGAPRPLRLNAAPGPAVSCYGDGLTGSRAAGEAAQHEGRWPPNVLLGPEAAAELDRQSGQVSGRVGRRQTEGNVTFTVGEPINPKRFTPGISDTGGASRFFPVFRYEAKAPGSERPRGDDGTAHPTVKPVDLMAWLVRLVTPPGGLVLDPFAGSGTTAEACIVEGFRCVLIEKDPAYAALIRKRLRKDIQPAMFGDVS